MAVPDQKPGFHFRPDRNWINDPCGPMYFNGVYHLFYQYNPNGTVHAIDTWGHAVSKDLVYWDVLPPALLADQYYDNTGVHDGSAFMTDNGPMIVYESGYANTSAGSSPDNVGNYQMTMNLAWPSNLSDPYLTNWTKASYNPIVRTATMPAGFLGGSDPSEAWRDPQGNYQFVFGAEQENRSSAAVIFRSPDLVNWQFGGVLTFENDTLQRHYICTEFYQLQGRYVFTAFPNWTVGSYDADTSVFTPQFQGQYDSGDAVCSKSFADGNLARRVAFIWLPEADSAAFYVKRNWAGAMTLPRVLSLDSGNNLVANPIPELASLRQNRSFFEAIRLEASNSSFRLPGVSGDQLEIATYVHNWTQAALAGVRVRVSQDSDEETIVYLSTTPKSPFSASFGLDRSRASLNDPVGNFAPAALYPVDPIELRIFVDHSVIEIYVNGGVYRMSGRVYPSLDDSIFIETFAKGLPEQASVTFENLSVWTMSSIWS
eukprot:TRINITY_DN5577_c0_g1_i4.p1 TRINITY_DN5577_c0_g1~~TRINITY_DN5577_c0_g1_i4.p1  ORF type:complete len:505 (-),score=125.71 TRINITY_DN5577_c0_g1_i4:509-1966(-)